MLFLMVGQLIVDRTCLEMGQFEENALVNSTVRVVEKHALNILKAKGNPDRVERLIKYARKRLSTDNPSRWLEISTYSPVSCGGQMWEPVFLTYPNLVERNDESLVDSAEALLGRIISDSIRSGAYFRYLRDTAMVAHSIALDIVGSASFLQALRRMGVENFRRKFTCGYW